MLDDKFRTYVILDNVRSAFNVGAIFRTCDATHCTLIILIGITPTPKHIKMDKTSVGAINFVSWMYFESFVVAKEWIMDNDKQFNVQTHFSAVEQSDNSISFYNQPAYLSMAFIFGHEITGISVQTLNLASDIVEIPMFGKKNSLNVATTVGIVLYERIRVITQ